MTSNVKPQAACAPDELAIWHAARDARSLLRRRLGKFPGHHRAWQLSSLVQVMSFVGPDFVSTSQHNPRITGFGWVVNVKQ